MLGSLLRRFRLQDNQVRARVAARDRAARNRAETYLGPVIESRWILTMYLMTARRVFQSMMT